MHRAVSAPLTVASKLGPAAGLAAALASGLACALALAACGGPSHDGPPGPDAGAGDAAPPPDTVPLGDPFAALQALPATCTADHWCWRTPRPAGNDYDRVYATAADNLWLLGQHGTVMQWDGHAWTTHHPPVPAGQLPAQFPFSISGRRAGDMWLIFGATVQHWDGAAWAIRDTVPPSGIVTFDSVWAAPGGDVWVTLSNGTLHRSTAGGAFQPVASGCGGCFLGSIWGTADDDFFITTLPAGILHYDGRSFSRSYAGPMIAGSYLGTRGDVWVAGGDGALLHWDGAAWTAVPTGLPSWVITGVAARAPDDVWWWATRSSAMSAFLHWDGASLTTTPVDTADIGAFLYSGAIVDGKWWLVGGAGAIYTRSGPDSVAPIVDPQVDGMQSMWGSSADRMYFASGGQIRHWNGQTTEVLPIAAAQIAGVRTGDVDELFAAGYDLTPDLQGYIASAYHFDGVAWANTEIARSTIAEHRTFTKLVGLGPGEALAVGRGGLAYRYAAGAWSPIAIGTTVDLAGVWAPDADHAWITGAGGTLLTWQRSAPDVAVPDATLPPTTADLGAIHGADGEVWISAGGSQALHGSAAGWTLVSTLVASDGIFAISARDVVVASSAQSAIARWDGERFTLEDSGSGTATPVVFRPPGGPMLAGWLWGMVEHP
jgi:hypothetical protein